MLAVLERLLSINNQSLRLEVRPGLSNMWPKPFYDSANVAGAWTTRNAHAPALPPQLYAQPVVGVIQRMPTVRTALTAPPTATAASATAPQHVPLSHCLAARKKPLCQRRLLPLAETFPSLAIYLG